MLEHIYHTIRGRTKWTTDPRIKFQRPLIGCKTLHVYVYIYIVFGDDDNDENDDDDGDDDDIDDDIYPIRYYIWTLYNIHWYEHIYIYQSHIRVSASIYLRIWYSLFERSMGICINHMSIYVVSFLTHICIYIYIIWSTHAYTWIFTYYI